MGALSVVGRITRVGHSLAVFIPAPEAKRLGLHPGQMVGLSIEAEVPSPFGLLKDLPYAPFQRDPGDRRDRL